AGCAPVRDFTSRSEESGRTLISPAPVGVQISGYLSMFLALRSEVAKGHMEALGTKHSSRRLEMDHYREDVHSAECISESHSALDRRCHSDVDELPYFEKHSEGDIRVFEAWGNSGTSPFLSLCLFFHSMGEKGGSASRHIEVSRGREGRPAAALPGKAFSP
ncbi:hypothetical protein IRJ41_020872, partial [Triplophysa rosa]